MKLLIFVTVAVWFYLLFSALTVRRRRISTRLTEFVIGAEPKRGKSQDKKSISIRRILSPLTRDWANRGSQKRLERTQLRLLRAGMPGGLSVSEWNVLHLIVTAIAAGIGILYVVLSGTKLSNFALLLAIILLGWIGPDFWLSRTITTRQATLRRQLPSTLDLLTVSVEAGLGFDQAMSRVAEEITGPMAEEIQRMLREMQMGSPRTQALQRVAYRTGVDVIELFVSSVVQAEKLGIGLARVLRIQAEEVRRKQRADAQEKALKAPIKILFPLVLFVFPALFIVILGPAALHIMQMFAQTKA